MNKEALSPVVVLALLLLTFLVYIKYNISLVRLLKLFESLKSFFINVVYLN
jgi:hypothetical protein